MKPNMRVYALGQRQVSILSLDVHSDTTSMLNVHFGAGTVCVQLARGMNDKPDTDTFNLFPIFPRQGWYFAEIFLLIPIFNDLFIATVSCMSGTPFCEPSCQCRRPNSWGWLRALCDASQKNTNYILLYLLFDYILIYPQDCLTNKFVVYRSTCWHWVQSVRKKKLCIFHGQTAGQHHNSTGQATRGTEISGA